MFPVESGGSISSRKLPWLDCFFDESVDILWPRQHGPRLWWWEKVPGALLMCGLLLLRIMQVWQQQCLHERRECNLCRKWGLHKFSAWPVHRRGQYFATILRASVTSVTPAYLLIWPRFLCCWRVLCSFLRCVR